MQRNAQSKDPRYRSQTQKHLYDYILSFATGSMGSKFSHRSPVLRRHVLEKFRAYLKNEGHSKRLAMNIAHTLGEIHLDSITQRRKEMDPYRKMNMRVSEAARAADFMGYASDVVKRLNRDHQTAISPREAATWIDAHNEILNVLPTTAKNYCLKMLS